MARKRLWLLLAAGIAGGLALSSDVDELWDRLRAFVVEPSVARYPIRGIDVSHHQGRIDWPRVKAAGQSFAFIKASEGADFRDTRFVENWSGAREAGLVTGAYHFFTFCAPGARQAANFLAAVPADAPGLPLAVDVEFTGNCRSWSSLQGIHVELLAFVTNVEAARNQRLLLYTTVEHFAQLIPRELHHHSFWLRSLWGQPRASVPWLFWQYSASGDVPGIAGRVDLNVFEDDEAAWQLFLASPAVSSRAPQEQQKDDESGLAR